MPKTPRVKKTVLKTKGPRTRRVRDPIHGDISVSPLEAAVIDTRTFQRLRYIRQNALLHFVFPGAVHTRFAHSIGTMAMARRVFDRFVEQLDARSSDHSIRYIGGVFRLAALLHDVGHCAFSHSIEEIRVKGRPFFGTLDELLVRWGREGLRASIGRHFPEKLVKPAMHEEIGAALIELLFEERVVAERCRAELGDPSSVANDICALILGKMEPSSLWQRHVESFSKLIKSAAKAGRFSGRVKKDELSDGLLDVLHSLISGTLDVDRMDYLRRDSYYMGVPYGVCDIDMIVSSLRLGSVGGRLDFFLDRKAVDCLDDMLWSRYQLFVQVLNHKANVALNMSLGQALTSAMSDTILKRPTTVEEYVGFTDDYVMDRVRAACIVGELQHRPYAKTLVDRRIPIHLGSETDPETKVGRERILKEKAAQFHIAPESIMVGTANSELLKSATFPTIAAFNRVTAEWELFRFEELSQVSKAAQMRRTVLHYFADRN